MHAGVSACSWASNTRAKSSTSDQEHRTEQRDAHVELAVQILTALYDEDRTGMWL